MNDVDDKLRKVLVDLPNHWATAAESMWAFLLDDGTYQIDNVPFYAYGLNYRDIVKVDGSEPDSLPVVVEVIEPSGHATIRVVFPKEIGKRKQKPIIDDLESIGVSVERAFENHVALDIPPEIDYDAVRDKLDEFENSGVLNYETCESRVEGRFDEGPDENDVSEENGEN
jgi:hypothetical protein